MATVSEVKEIATLISAIVAPVGVVIAVGSLAFSAFNTWLTVRTTRARFWLDLRSAFSKHDPIHQKLHPRGDWHGGLRPPSAEEQYQVEAYMGLFEHCEIMIEQRLLDAQTFREIYRYRLINLVGNRWVRIEKLCKISHGWQRLIALLKRMDVPFDCKDVDGQQP